MSNIITKKKPKEIPADENLRDYLAETLELEKLKKLNKIDGSPIGSHNQLRIRNNDARKVWTLDNLFESMANLIYFFEFLNDNPELIDKFGDDIEDLFGLRGHTNPKYFAFPRFIRAIIGEGYPDYDDKRFNFRRRLMKIMHYSINQKAMSIVAFWKHDPLGLSDTRFRDKVFNDLQNAEVWINYLDRFTGNEMKNSNRLLGT